MRVRRFKCRVLFVNSAAKIVGLSSAPHIVSWSPAKPTWTYGEVVDSATVIRVDGKQGLVLSLVSAADSDVELRPAGKKDDGGVLQRGLQALSKAGSIAVAALSHISDSKVEHIERSFRVGSTVKCRVIGERVYEIVREGRDIE